MHLRSNFKVNMIRACSKIDSKRHACTREWIKKSAVNIGAWALKTWQQHSKLVYIPVQHKCHPYWSYQWTEDYFSISGIKQMLLLSLEKSNLHSENTWLSGWPEFLCLVLRTVPLFSSTVWYRTVRSVILNDRIRSTLLLNNPAPYGTVLSLQGL